MSLLLLLDISVSSGPTSPSNAQILPLLSVAFGGMDGDLLVKVTFFQEDGVTPLSLLGITFSGSIYSTSQIMTALSSTGGSPQISTSGTGNNVLSINVPAVQVDGWAPGQYAMSIDATDGTYTVDLFASALVVVGTAIPSVASVVSQRSVQTI